MKRIIIEQFEQSQIAAHQLAREAHNLTDKQVSRFCAAELRNLEALHDALYSPQMDHIMVAVTSTGNLGLVWILSALALVFYEPDRAVGYSMIIALLLCIMIGNLTIKNVVKRNRPFFHKNYKLLIKQPWDYSFPSGHTLSSFAAATVFFYLNQAAGVIALFYACMIALSRLYLRVHFFTDVLASMFLGTGLGMLAVYLYNSNFFGLLG